MSAPDKPASGPGVITVTLVILVIAACVCIAAAAWLYFGGRYKSQLAFNEILLEDIRREQKERSKIFKSYRKENSVLKKAISDQRRGFMMTKGSLEEMSRGKKPAKKTGKAVRVAPVVEVEEEKICVIRGVVYAYNEPQRRIELNVGKEHGVKKGMIFYIFDLFDLVGIVEVREVQPGTSTCNVKWCFSPMREGMEAGAYITY